MAVVQVGGSAGSQTLDILAEHLLGVKNSTLIRIKPSSARPAPHQPTPDFSKTPEKFPSHENTKIEIQSEVKSALELIATKIFRNIRPKTLRLSHREYEIITNLKNSHL